MNSNSEPETNNNEIVEETVVESVNEELVVEEDLNALKSELETLKTNLQDSLNKQEEYLNMAQRIQADFDNFRKRNASIRKDSYDEATADFSKAILPVIDNFERAIDNVSEKTAFFEGVALTHKQLLDLLDKKGIKQINRIGEVFDPNLEEAVTHGAPEDGESGTVCEVLQKGYMLENTVIRYAMVKVVP